MNTNSQINSKGNIQKAATIIAVFTLLSRFVGLYRDHLFASRFGAGDILDAYYVAFRIPDLIFNLLILGTLSVAFIPIFTERFIKDKEEANDIANTVLGITFVSMTAVCVVLFFFVPELTRLTAPGFTGQKFINTVMLTRIFLVSPILFTLSNVFSSVLNSLKRFALVSIAPIIYNFGIIFGIVFLYPRFGIAGLAYGVLLGVFLHFLTQMAGALRAGFKFKPSWDTKNPAVRRMFRLFLPRILGIDNSQMSLLIASIIGSTFAAGTVAVFNLANNLQAVAIGMFGISFGIAAFPYLSESFAHKDEPAFSQTLLKTSLNILFFVVPISVLMFLLRAQIVRVILGAGQFNWEATKLTANTLGIFAISIFAQSIAPLFSRAFYARQNTRVPVVIGLCTLALNAVSSVFLARQFGPLGLIIGFSFSNIVNAMLLFVFLRPRLHQFDDQKLFSHGLKIVFASLLLGIATFTGLHLFSMFFKLNTTINVLLQGLFAGGIGIAVYAIMAHLLGLEETKSAISLVKRRLLR